MSDLGIDPDGAAVGEWLAHDIGVMFLQLVDEPAGTVAEHDRIPPIRGVYLFSNGERTVMLGLADDLRRSLLAAVNPDGPNGSTYLSFWLARWMAKRAGLDVDHDRKHLEADRDFAPHYNRAKELVPDLMVRFMTHRNLVQRQILALYAEVRLNAPIPSRLYPEWEGPASLDSLAASDQDDPPAGALTTVGGGGSVATVALDDASCRGLDRDDFSGLGVSSGPSKAQLGRAIRQIRNERRLTQEQVADRAFIDETYLSAIETGKRNPSWKSLTAISAALNFSTATLVARAEES
ncbi:MAG: helix-turn-helix domain-containing protein [Solirubrobacterales bacterium]